MKHSIFPDGETLLLCGAFEPHLGWNGMRMNYRIFQRLLMTGKPSPKRDPLRGNMFREAHGKKQNPAEGVSKLEGDATDNRECRGILMSRRG